MLYAQKSIIIEFQSYIEVSTPSKGSSKSVKFCSKIFIRAPHQSYLSFVLTSIN